MTTCPFNVDAVDPTWNECLKKGIKEIDHQYLTTLTYLKDWLPGPDKIFNAFSLPINQVNYVLFGESPYPRRESANGYAFWDASVHELWSSSGFSKKVNRATSLRNLLKMLLVAEGLLDQSDCKQEAIAKIDKSSFIQTNDELFNNLLNRGFLLLNATLVLANSPQKDAKAWHPFIREILNCLLEKRPRVKFILLGRIANQIADVMPKALVDKLCSPHPYNLSFITNSQVINFFKPLHLLHKNDQSKSISSQ